MYCCLSDWRDNILSEDNISIPEEILPGAEAARRREAYAQILTRQAEKQYPTAFLAAELNRRDSWTNQNTQQFLQAKPDFDFAKQRILPTLSAEPEILEQLPDPEAGRDDLLRLEQLFHVAPAQDRADTIQTLWNASVRSAPAIAAMGRQQLMQQTENGLSQARLNQIYQKAIHTTALALNLFMRYSPSLNQQPLHVMKTKQPLAGQGVAQPATALPEWSELFGSADSCECIHCVSALSPAAYMVDMMAFLQRATTSDGSGKNGLDILLERRPDLGHLRLNCQNTEATLPTIDLVIEIMEQIVANGTDNRTIPTACASVS